MIARFYFFSLCFTARNALWPNWVLNLIVQEWISDISSWLREEKKTKSSCTSVLSVLLVMSTTRVSNKILTFFLPTPTHEPLECKIAYYVHTICRKQNIHITYWATYLREGSSRLSMRKLWPENQKIIKSLVHHAFEEVLWRKTWERDRVGVWDLYPSSHTFTVLFPRLPNKVDQGRD